MIYKGIMKALVIILCLLCPLCALAADFPEITADAYLLVEKDTFAVIAGKNYHTPLPPASTTKVMTTVLALERLEEDDAIVPTRNVLSLPASKLSLVPGRSYRAIDLITGAMVESANDAAYSLAVGIAGSEERFAEMMNEKAREIGALESNFENASGLYAPGHVASAYDLALIFRYALEKKRFEEIVGTKYFLFKNGRADVRYMNHNRFLFCFAPSIGGKTGFTHASKHCYVGAFEKDGRVYILSILGSRNLWGDATEILQQIYTDVPSQKEMSLVKASNVVLSGYDLRNARKIKLSSYKFRKEVSKEKKFKEKKKLRKAKKRKRLKFRRA